MSFIANMKGNRAYSKQLKGDTEGARRQYAEAYSEGLNNFKLLLSYAILLMRSGDYERTCDVLRRAEKTPKLQPQQKTQVIAYYAIAIWKQGRIDKAIELLTDVFRKNKVMLVYQALGFLYIEKGDADAALAFNKEAVEYDDEDPIFLDNLAQTYYRLLNDREQAKPLFEKALIKRADAIDTNYFLAQYDKAEGNDEAALARLQRVASGRFAPLNFATPELVAAEIAELEAKLAAKPATDSENKAE